MMTNKMKYDVIKRSDAFVVTITLGYDGAKCNETVGQAAERFLQSAALLPEKEFLGMKLWADKDQQPTGYVFSSDGSKMAVNDFTWIFQKCAFVDKDLPAPLRDLFEQNRKVYALASVEGSSKDVSEISDSRENEYVRFCDDSFSKTPDEDFQELLEMLKEENALFCFVAGGKAMDSQNHGSVFISIPGDMPLRMRTLLSRAVPHTNPVEIQKTAETDEADICLPDNVLVAAISELLFAIIYKNRQVFDEEEFVDKDDDDLIAALFGDDEEDDDDDDDDDDVRNTLFTPIEELELSVRAYNCLKRAGIHSVEKLRTISEEELGQIRNLGRRSLGEITQKLQASAHKENTSAQKTVGFTEQLQELIGLSEVKEQMRKITAYAKMKKAMRANAGGLTLSLNMEFVGNPGTAKTTVARMAAGIFHEIGLLSRSEPVEVGRADLVGQYAGETAIKVKETFRKARGRLLFIDEAYSLTEHWEGGYGDEAINTIVQEMENNREKVIVVFAGYPDKMEAFFDRNPGLRSRVPFCIHFKDYSAVEMLQIVEFEAGKRGFKLDPSTRDKIVKLCEEEAGRAESGNGRFCRNLVENAILEYAVRVYGGDAAVNVKVPELLPEDFSRPSVPGRKKTNPIGFCA